MVKRGIVSLRKRVEAEMARRYAEYATERNRQRSKLLWEIWKYVQERSRVCKLLPAYDPSKIELSNIDSDEKLTLYFEFSNGVKGSLEESVELSKEMQRRLAETEADSIPNAKWRMDTHSLADDVFEHDPSEWEEVIPDTVGAWLEEITATRECIADFFTFRPLEEKEPSNGEGEGEGRDRRAGDHQTGLRAGGRVQRALRQGA